MIFSSDLMKGLTALQEAEVKNLNETQSVYAIPGLSFTPNELFAEIRKHHPGFGFCVYNLILIWINLLLSTIYDFVSLIIKIKFIENEFIKNI